MIRYDTSIFSPDTYHAAILAALRQSAASQDARYLDMLATMNGMKKPIPNLQSGIVNRLPDAPYGYNNSHNGPSPSSLLPPPLYQPAESPTQSRHSAPDTVAGFDTGTGGGTDVYSGNTPVGVGGGTGDTSGDSASVTPAQLGFPGWDQIGNPAPNTDFTQNAPPAPPSNPLNEPDVTVAPTEMATPAPAAPVNTEVSPSEQAAIASAITDPGGFVAGARSSGTLQSVNNDDMTSPDPSAISVGLPASTMAAVNQSSKGDSLDANAVSSTPTSTVAVSPGPIETGMVTQAAPAMNAINDSLDQSAVNDIANEVATPSPSPAPPGYQPGDMAVAAPAAPASPANALANAAFGLLADLTGAKANAPANALAQEQENGQQAEQAAQAVGLLNASPANVSANVSNALSVNNDLSTTMADMDAQSSAAQAAAMGLNVDGASLGHAVNAGTFGDAMNGGPVTGPGFGDMSAANVDAASMGFANDGGLTAGLNGTGFGGLSDATASGFNGGFGTDSGNAVAGPGFGGSQADTSGFGGISAGGFAGTTGGFNADGASVSAAASGALEGGTGLDNGGTGYGGITGGFGGFSGLGVGFDAASGSVDATGGFTGTDASAGVDAGPGGVSADASASADASSGVDAGGW